MIQPSHHLCEEGYLDKEQFKALIDTYIYNEHKPLREEIFKCLDNRSSVLKAWAERETVNIPQTLNTKTINGKQKTENIQPACPKYTMAYNPKSLF